MINAQQQNIEADVLENILNWEIRDFIELGFKLERRAQVEYLPKIGTLNVYKDHNPPHFHLKTEKYDLVVSIDNCELIKGALSSKQKKGLEDWFFNHNGKEKIIFFWNRFNENNLLKN